MQTQTKCRPEEEKYQPGSLPEVFQLVGEVAKKLKNMESQALRVDHLTPPQYYVLTQLCESDEQPFKDLAEMLSCSRATVTGIVDTMEKKGLVKRIPNPEDRRSMRVQLCDKGRELVRNTAGMKKAFGGCCSLLEPEEAAQLAGLLGKLNERLNF
jgi:DNA-binding MarR family transcriptional regulator